MKWEGAPVATKDQPQNPNPGQQNVDGLDESQLRDEARRLGIADADTLDQGQLRDRVRQQRQA